MKTIIMDVGNVIQPITWEEGAKVLGAPVDDYKIAFRKDGKFDQYKIGELPFPQYADFVLQTLGIESSEVNIERFSESIKNLWGNPYPHVIDLIKRLNPSIEKAILSNSCTQLEERAKSYDRTDLSYVNLFEPHVYFSHRIGVAKPDRRAIEAVTKGLNVSLEDCLFVDDSEKNRVLAPNFFLYTTPEKLEKRLEPYLTR